MNYQVDDTFESSDKTSQKIRELSEWAKEALHADMWEWYPKPDSLSKDQIEEKLLESLQNIQEEDKLSEQEPFHLDFQTIQRYA